MVSKNAPPPPESFQKELWML
ncbi:hypothetical protein IBTHAUMO2_590084 [Nitrosopumilaceae archaeon]|nr:hypothetical protein IBTHAUMO2_590084 [Nitrosopumilaceae archaeon]